MTKNKASLAGQDIDARLDKRRARMNTAAFKKVYRQRSGIEAANSQLERMGLKKLRVRGRASASFKIFFKVLALNCMRVCSKAIRGAKQGLAALSKAGCFCNMNFRASPKFGEMQ